MRSTAISLVAGAVVALALWRALRPLFGLSVFQRSVGGARVPTSVGIVVVLTVLAVEAWFAMLHSASAIDDTDAAWGRRTVMFTALGFGFVGLVTDLADLDDQAGSATEGLAAAGYLRWIGGAAAALVVTIGVPRPSQSLVGLLLDALLVSLAANLGSRTVTSPGRATKLAVLAVVPLLAFGAHLPRLAGPALVVGAALALLRPELSGRLRLGEVGGSVLGAALGVGACLTLGVPGRSGVLAALVLVSVAGELGWVDRAFERVRPLRALDRWGRA